MSSIPLRRHEQMPHSAKVFDLVKMAHTAATPNPFYSLWAQVQSLYKRALNIREQATLLQRLPPRAPSSTSSPVSTSSTPSTSSGELLSAAAISTTHSFSTTPSSSTFPASNHVDVGVGVGIGLPVGLALCAGLAYLLRRRPKTPSDQHGIQAYLDDKKELHANQKTFHENCELVRDSRLQELSEQGLVDLQCLHEHSAVERD